MTGCVQIAYKNAQTGEMYTAAPGAAAKEKKKPEIKAPTPLPANVLQRVQGMWGGIIRREYICISCTIPGNREELLPVVVETTADGMLLVDHYSQDGGSHCRGYLNLKEQQGNILAFDQRMFKSSAGCYKGEVYFKLVDDHNINYFVSESTGLRLKRIPRNKKEEFFIKGKKLFAEQIQKEDQREKESVEKIKNALSPAIKAFGLDKVDLSGDNILSTSSGGGGVKRIIFDDITSHDDISSYTVLCNNSDYYGGVRLDMSSIAIYNYYGLGRSTAQGNFLPAIGDEKLAAKRICE